MGIFAEDAEAIDPSRALSQYIRDRFGPQEGFPRGPVYAITQTPDGYLWIGTEAGLVRFDGLSFRLVEDEASSLSITNVLGLAADADGSLWVRLQGSRLLRYRDGSFDSPSFDTDWPYSIIGAMGLSNKGEVLIARMEQGASTYRNGKFEMVASTQSLPRSPIMSLAQTPDGNVWMGTRDAGVFRLGGSSIQSINEGLPDPKINCLLAVDNDDVWIGTDTGIARWTRNGLSVPRLPQGLSEVQVLTLHKDRDANLWVGTNSHGLLRFTDRGLTSVDRDPVGSSAAITAIFEDREGNLWVGSSRGIERFRDSAFVTYTAEEGLPSDSNGPIHIDAHDRTWFAPVAGGLYWMKDGAQGTVTGAGLDRDVVYTIAGSDDELWIGRQRGGLTQLRRSRSGFTARTYTSADGLVQNSVYATYISRDGSVWAGTLNGGVSKLKNGKFTTLTIENGLASNTVSTIFEGATGTMWFGTSGGLSALTENEWKTFTVREGLPSNQVNSLFEDSSGVVWIGTASGIALLEKNKIRVPLNLPTPLKEQILGIVMDRRGSLWMSTSNHVVRVEAARLLRGEIGNRDVQEFGLADGLHGVEGVKRNRSVVLDSRGRVWFSMNQGLSLVDPGRLNTSAPALPAIQTISVDGETTDARSTMNIPPGTRRIAIGYAGLILSVPERVQFRYVLEGLDPDWVGPVVTREAVYTNLDPGTYTFRLMASNADGVWNDIERTISLNIAPAYWQTYWFRVSAIMFVALTIGAIYRYRLFELTRQLNVRFEERLDERTRIAHELHDTLLQGFLSASMQLDVAMDRLPEDSPVKPTLRRILQLMGKVTEEGRHAVQGLRSSDATALDLQQAFSRIKQELAVPDAVKFQVVAEGRQRPLHPIIRDEAYRIGREALVNAFRHSQARSIEVELEYSSNRLRVLVRDDGCGIDKQVLASGRDGHWGLSGMRERAEKIGAVVSVWSRGGAGTEVELSVPAHIAYEPEPGQQDGWFVRWRRSRTGRINERKRRQE